MSSAGSDLRESTRAALGVVPIDDDVVAMRPLHRIPLVQHAVAALAASGVVTLVVVAASPGLVATLSASLAAVSTGTGVPVRVVPAVGTGAGRQLDVALAETGGDPAPELVVLHYCCHPLATPELVKDVVARLSGEDARAARFAAAIPVRPVVDTLKVLDREDAVTGTVQREGFRLVFSPQVYRREALAGWLAEAADDELDVPGPDAIPRLVQRVGGRLLSVPAPGELVRIVVEEDLMLAAAMMQVREHTGER